MEPSRTSGGLYHSVTTSEENVWHGMDLDRARPEGGRRQHAHGRVGLAAEAKMFTVMVCKGDIVYHQV